MASEFDQSDFVDSDFQAAQKSAVTKVASAPAVNVHGMTRPPTREELDAKVSETHQRLAELKRVQEALERERATLEESRRRQAEFQTGRQEMLQNLTRGIGLLGEAEFAARRDAEQMAKTLAGFNDALAKVQAIKSETWTVESYQVELSKALTIIENARMEWNSARLKWPILSGNASPTETNVADKSQPKPDLLADYDFWKLCKVGLAMSWPVAVVALAAVIILAIMLSAR